MFEEVRERVAKIIALYEGEKNRADSLAAELDSRTRELESCRMQIIDLKRQTDTLKLKTALSSNADNREARERLDNLIREIDKCISLFEG